MKYHVKPGQVSYGEPIGIMVIENYAPYIPGDTANASSYDFPVRFQRIPGTTPNRLFAHDQTLWENVRHAAGELVREGVRAVTGDCGFLAVFQDRLAEELDVPVFLSSLLQLDFIDRLTGPKRKTAVITASESALDRSVLDAVTNVPAERLVIRGLEDKPSFHATVIDEVGELDADEMEREVLDAAGDVTKDPSVGAILLECSMLPPYAVAVQETTGLPVFDYTTMINYMFSAAVRFPFQGFM